MKWMVGATIGVVLATSVGMAWSQARHRGKVSHCRNNLLWLGELGREALREASLNPDLPDYEELKNARGRAFWQVVWRIKLARKPRELSPFACPFKRETKLSATESLKLDDIDYRGPAFNIFDAGSEFVPVAADRFDNHDAVTVLFIKSEVKTKRTREEDIRYFEFVTSVETVSRSDPRWSLIESKTSD